MALTPTDRARINESLSLVHDEKKTAMFFSPDTDAFFAMCEDNVDNSNGGKSFVVDVVGEGDITSNSSMLEAGGRAIYDEFTIPATTEHIRGQITEDALLSAKTRDQANGGFDLSKETIDMHIRRAKVRLGIHAGGKGWGSLAGIQARTTGASGTITLGMPDGTSATAIPDLARRFFVGMKLYAADAEDSGDMRGTQVTPTTSDAVATITAINEQTGVLTCDTVPASFAVGDYIGQQGNRYFSAANGRRLMTGVEAWLSPEVSTGTLGGKSLNGRADLQPIRFDASNKSIKQALIEADKYHYTSGKPREGLAIITTPEILLTLNVKQEALKTIEITRDEKGKKGATVTISVAAYQLQGMNAGLIPVIASNFWRPRTAVIGPFMSKTYQFRLKHGGDRLVNMHVEKGEMLRYVQGGVLDSDGLYVPGYEFNGFIRCALTCKHPNAYCVITNLYEA